MGVTVRVTKNELPRIIRDLPDEVDKAVDDTATSIADLIKATIWKRTGTAYRTTQEHTEGSLHSTVQVGVHRGRAFYVIFDEFGTSRQAAQPVVGPAAHIHEPVLVAKATDAVRKACRV